MFGHARNDGSGRNAIHWPLSVTLPVPIRNGGWLFKRASPILLVVAILQFFSFTILDPSTVSISSCGRIVDESCFANSWIPETPIPASTSVLAPGSDGKPQPGTATTPTRIQGPPPVFEKPPKRESTNGIYARYLFSGTFSMAILGALAVTFYAFSIVKYATRADGYFSLAVLSCVAIAFGYCTLEMWRGAYGATLLGQLLFPAMDYLPPSWLTYKFGVWFPSTETHAAPSAHATAVAVRAITDFVAALAIASMVMAAAALTDKEIGNGTAAGQAPVPQGPAQSPNAAAIQAPPPPAPIGVIGPAPLSPSDAEDAFVIATRITMLNKLLYAGSASFVLSLMAIRAFTSWPITLAGTGSLLAKEMSTLASTVLVSWGGTMSALLLVIYATPAFWLDRQADRLLTSNIQVERQEQKKRYGLSVDLSDHVSKVIIALLPLLAGGLEALLTKFMF